MRDRNADVVHLDALSNSQRDLVESHLPLVQHTLNRHRHLVRSGRDAAELFQEGCLALIESVRNHDPQRHGHFAAFAMARMHFALSKFVHENDSAVRVPFITQRRKRAAAVAANNRPPSAKSGAPLPVVQRLADYETAAPQVSGPNASPIVRIGELIRERLDENMKHVIHDLKASPRCAPGTRDVVELCARERWRIPEPEARTSIRKLAKELDCSVGRITHCEERYRKRMNAALSKDATYCKLRDWARRSHRGFDEPMSAERIAKLRPDGPGINRK